MNERTNETDGWMDEWVNDKRPVNEKKITLKVTATCSRVNDNNDNCRS